MSNQKQKQVADPKRRTRKVLFFGVIGCVALLLGVAAVYAFTYSSRILPHTTIAGVDVGGLTKAQAVATLQKHEQEFSTSTLAITAEGKSWQVPALSLDLHFNTDEIVSTAFDQGKEGAFLGQLKALALAPVHSAHYAEVVAPLTPTGQTALQSAVLKEIEQPAQETTIDFTGGLVKLVSGKAGSVLDADAFIAAVKTAYNSQQHAVALPFHTIQPKVSDAGAQAALQQAQAIFASPWQVQIGSKTQTVQPPDMAGWFSTSVATDNTLALSTKDDQLQQVVKSWAAKTDQSPVDAQLGVTNGAVAVVKDGQDGSKMDTDATFQVLKTTLLATDTSSPHTIQATVAVAQPDIRTETLTSLGLTQLIGTGTTDFTGSPGSRVTNITKGTQMINGQLVKDGQEFSTIKALGPIDQAHGYVQGLVIVNNKTMPADGGGLCQVSTTLFRSALNAGLPITARTSHSYEVSYYQRGVGPGLDATIYDPNPDFRWKNDTGHAIYIQGYIKGKTLTFELYGTSDGRTASIDGPHTLQTFEPSGDPIYVNTSTLAKGVTERIDPPVQGARTTATYTVTRNGQVINTQTFNSFYQAMPAQYLVGTR